MRKKEFILNEEFRMKVINYLMGYGCYKGILVKGGNDKLYINGEVKIDQIITNKKDFQELKLGVNCAIDDCYRNSYYEISDIIEFFYKFECENIRKRYGSFFDRR